MTKVYDATTEHAKIEKTVNKSEKTKGHPNKGIKGKNSYSGKSAS